MAWLNAEAASDARYMHDMLRKMLKAPIFLDSSELSDLRTLITGGVHKSDTLVLLGTKCVLSRPVSNTGARTLDWLHLSQRAPLTCGPLSLFG